MTDLITPTQFHELPDLSDWRALLRNIEATFQATSFSTAIEFARRVVDAATLTGSLPDIDVRSSGTVRIVLTSSTHGLSTHDVELARMISALARNATLLSNPRMSSRLEIAIDATDIAAVLPFWRTVLAYEDEPTKTVGEPVHAIVDPLRIGPSVWFQQMDHPRPQRNRIHLDITVPHDVAEERISAALAAGGRLVSDEAARAFWILADQEGNEVCVCTFQDRE